MKTRSFTNLLLFVILCSWSILDSCTKNTSLKSESTLPGYLSANTSLNTVSTNVVGTTYYIPQGGIADHANASTVHSIAWYFATYGTGNTYVLSTPSSYYNLNSLLTVPANSVFQGNDTISGNWKLAATSGLDNKVMIKLGSGCLMQYLYVNGAHYSASLINMTNTTGTIINRCTIFDSKNNFISSQGNAYTLLIHATGSTNGMIKYCTMRRAGSDPKVNDTLNKSQGYAIYMSTSTHPSIVNNNIGSTLTCGIGIGVSTDVVVTGNTLTNTGQNRNMTTGVQGGPIGDAITAYHNWIVPHENFNISNNVINGSGNHGIHVSGYGVNIQNNTISNQYLCGVQVDDWRTTAPGIEYSANVVVKNNKIGQPVSLTVQPGNPNRKIAVNHVDNTLTLDYQVNKELNGTAMVVNAANYQFPVIFGPHP